MSIITKSITDQIYNIIKNRILMQEYKLGSKIDMNELAEEHEISIMPVRDALKRLSNQGLVTNKSRVGFFVRKFSEEEIRNIMEVRNMYETYCLQNHYNNLEMKKVKKIYESIECNKSLNRKEFDKIDTEFHNLIIQAAENDFLINHYNEINDLIVLFKHLDKQRIKLANEEHCSLMKSILDGDIEVAVEKLEQHIRNVKNSVIDNVKN